MHAGTVSTRYVTVYFSQLSSNDVVQKLSISIVVTEVSGWPKYCYKLQNRYSILLHRLLNRRARQYNDSMHAYGFETLYDC